LTAPTSNSGGAFTYTSSNTAVATISGTTVTIVGTGTSVITATQAANGAYGSGSTTASFVVSFSAAPLPPCRASSDVVALYNEGPYTISTTGNNWGASGQITESSFVGNKIKLIADTNYAQIAFSTTTAAAAMTFLHVDIYSTTTNASQVMLYVNAQTGHYPTPNGVWTSLDIPASSLGGFASVNIVKILLGGLGTFYVDNIYFWRDPTTPTITTTQPNCASATGTITVTAPSPGTGISYSIDGLTYTNSTGKFTLVSSGTYSVTTKNSSGCISPAASPPVVLNPFVLVDNIWNGTGWDKGTPDENQNIVFSGNYNTPQAPISANLIACSCQVNSGTVTIGSGNTMTLTNSLTVSGGSLTFEYSASLVQINDVPNIGDITYNRQTTRITKMDYTYWSTPVLPFTLGEVSPDTSGDKMYSFDSNIDNWKQESPATSMVPGVGYIIRGPQNFVYPMPPSTYIAPFVGVPNNGDYDIKGIVAGRSYLLGNPYPSALDADEFLVANQNVLEGTLYFWTHNTPIAIGTPNPGSGVYAYSGNDYASYNRTGGVATAALSSISGNNENIPSGKIASGQGFFGSSKDPLPSTPIIIFDNTMRVGVIDITKEDNFQFFKTKNLKAKTNIQLEKHRIWLDLTNSQGAFKQTLVGYVTDATNGYEDRFDGESYDGNDFLDFYSINEEKNLTIQGRAVPFDENDEIPLGYRIALGGSFTISIDETDGLLTNQAVYLEDKATNTIFNLKNGNYTFTTDKGTFNDRFVLRYTDKTLGTVAVEKPANKILVTIQNKQIKITSFAETIEKVFVYDVSGKQCYQKRNVNNTELLITTLAPSHQILLVKTVLQNGKSSTKKVLF
jgi:hypothetical protein